MLALFPQEVMEAKHVSVLLHVRFFFLVFNSHNYSDKNEVILLKWRLLALH